MDFCLCNNEQCEKSSSCNRFLTKTNSNPVYIRFQNICREKNNYQWYWEVKSELVPTDGEGGDKNE